MNLHPEANIDECWAEISALEAANARLRTQCCGGNCRYWEGRWRDEVADNAGLLGLLREALLYEGNIVQMERWSRKVQRALAAKDTKPTEQP